VFNTIVSLLIAGGISASGANYLLTLEKASKKVVYTYTESAEVRFVEYERMIPGRREKPDARRFNLEAVGIVFLTSHVINIGYIVSVFLHFSISPHPSVF